MEALVIQGMIGARDQRVAESRACEQVWFDVLRLSVPAQAQP
jgi:hypothetical protein